MHLDIRGLNLSLTPCLLEHVERRLRFALGRFDGRVTRVAVRVSAGGGVDKRCRIAVRLRPVGEIIVEDAGADLYAAIDVAAERIGRSVRHEVERLREGARIPPRLSRTIGRLARDQLG